MEFSALEIMNYKDLSAEGEPDEGPHRCVPEGGKESKDRGHCPGLTGADLNRFIYEGVDADHTSRHRNR